MNPTRRKLLIGGAVAVALGAGGYPLLRGFEDDPAENFTHSIPARLRTKDAGLKAGATGAALDVHVHMLGVGTGGTGCWMHEEMKGSIQARAGLWNLRLSIDQPDLDQAYVEYLRSRIR